MRLRVGLLQPLRVLVQLIHHDVDRDCRGRISRNVLEGRLYVPAGKRLPSHTPGRVLHEGACAGELPSPALDDAVASIVGHEHQIAVDHLLQLCTRAEPFQSAVDLLKLFRGVHRAALGTDELCFPGTNAVELLTEEDVRRRIDQTTLEHLEDRARPEERVHEGSACSQVHCDASNAVHVDLVLAELSTSLHKLSCAHELCLSDLVLLPPASTALTPFRQLRLWRRDRLPATLDVARSEDRSEVLQGLVDHDRRAKRCGAVRVERHQGLGYDILLESRCSNAARGDGKPGERFRLVSIRLEEEV